MSADTQKQPGPAQGLHLILSPDDKPAIQSITVTVYAVPPTLRALPLAAMPDDTISKTVELNRQPGYDSLREANVWMHKVGSISRVDLISTISSAWAVRTCTICRSATTKLYLHLR